MEYFVIGFLIGNDLTLPPFEIKKAGVITIEAVDVLLSKFVLKKEWLKKKKLLGEYPKRYKGLWKCHLRALYSVLPKAAKLALSKKNKTPSGIRDTKMPSTV
jgi:hypothetical protein